jgi:hypothetical protein
VDYRPKTNVTILLDIGYTKERPHVGGMGGIRQGKETKNLNVVYVLTGMKIEILNWLGPPWEGD